VSAFSPGGVSLASDADALASALGPFAVTAGGVGTLDAIALQKRVAGTAVQVTPYVAETTEGIVGSASPRDLETFFQLFYLYVTAPRADSAAYDALLQGFHTMFENRELSPQTAMSDTLTVLLSQNHPRRQPLTAARIDSVTMRHAIAQYEDRFRDAGDFTVVIVGAVNLDSLRPMVERYVASLPTMGRVERPRDVGVRPPTGRIERFVRRGLEPQSSTSMVFTSDFEYGADNRAALSGVAEVLSIMLREQLREALGATYGVGVGASASKFPVTSATLTVNFGSGPERADELVAGVLAAIDSLREHGPSPDVLAKVKETMLRERETSVRENRYWLDRIGGALELGEDPRVLLGAEARIQALSVERVRDAARRWVLPERFVRVTLLPAA
ncbi:MAG: insulinase family protein, partial [Gemmatimonadaceae bacterium]|nr:insulinase family protein [Gemmatimonadaceae bacterium]